MKIRPEASTLGAAVPIPQTMGWSSPSSSASAAVKGGYRPREDECRWMTVRAAVVAAVLAAAAVALGVDPSRLANAALVGR